MKQQNILNKMSLSRSTHIGENLSCLVDENVTDTGLQEPNPVFPLGTIVSMPDGQGPERASGPSPRGFLALHKIKFKSKPLGARDKDLLSIEVRKGLLHRQSSGLSP